MNVRIGTWVMVAALALGSTDAAWAKRLGGGGSVGKQSSHVTQRQGTTPQQPAPPAQPAQPSAAPQAAAPTPAAAGAAAKPRTPWGAMLGGLAAGLGLAWLASALGFGEALAQFLVILLLVGAVLAVVVLLRRSRAAAPRPAWAGAGRGVATDPLTPRSYQPHHVGNDAAARPWEHTAFDAASGGGVRIGSALSGPQPWGIPADFDVAGFLRASKDNFVRLQAAWDRGDGAVLRALMTDDMLAEIQAQLAQRQAQGDEPHVTEVVALDAQLLGIEESADEYLASVEFSGLIRENPAEGPAPFREVWNITKRKDGRSGWLVAGVQALQ
ncbi:MAG: Tim44-like domain-containing protein [Tepidimonas sp.]|uniref:Tim44 domain-containing protein n=1 Tax=Tepidimonas sp. TaxID=2002775 RepID=UPI00298EDE42|nr:Tim44-like domain-containing protein [Tepidimonas sp.]MDW8336448.1 Tim44-like domain-containing protein [Tepidimonas sp.]